MFEEQQDPALRDQEEKFQKMLVNNMESVFKIFFRGMKTIRVKSESFSSQKGGTATKNLKNTFNLETLAANKIV